MRHLFLTLLVLFMTSGITFAQNTVVMVDDVSEQYWVGVSGGFASGFGGVFHFGIEDAIGAGADIRINAILQGNAFGIGADALVDVGITLDAPIDVYAGAGAFGAFSGDSNAIAVSGLVGGEYRLSELDLEALGVFLEAGPALLITPSFNFSVVANFGVNFHF